MKQTSVMTRYFRVFCCAIIILSFSACSYFFPQYKKPKTDIPQKWNSSNSNVTQAPADLPYLEWWKKFNDPMLDSLIEKALDNNLTIQIAKANMEAAQSQLNTVKLNWLPFVNLFGGYIGGTSQNTFTSLGSLGAIGNTGAFFAVIPQYTLNLFRNYALQKQATYLLNMSRADILCVRLAIVSQVAGAYFACLAQEQLIKQFEDLDNKVVELIDITRNMEKVGLATGIGISDFAAQDQLIKGQTALLKRNRIAAQNSLRFLMNETPGSLNALGKFSAINQYQIVPGNLPVAVIESRPDIMKAEEQLKAANEGISVASTNLLPGVNLNYFYADTRSSVNNNRLSDLDTNQNYYAAMANWSLSPAMFGQIDINKAVFKAALASYNNTVNVALHEVDNALAINSSYNEKMANDEKALLELEESNRLKDSLYKKGLLTYTILIGSQIEQDLLEIVITQTKLQQLVSLVVLYQSLGGGYNYKLDSAKKEGSH